MALLALTALLALLGSLALLVLFTLRFLLRLRRLLCLLALLASCGSPSCLYLAFDHTFVVFVVVSTLQSPPKVYGLRWDTCVKSDGTYQSFDETYKRWAYSNLSKNGFFVAWVSAQSCTCMVARFVYLVCCLIWLRK